MTKVEVVEFEYECCGECPNAERASKGRHKCLLKRKIIPDINGDIPEWCPLEEKEVNNGNA